MNIYNEWNNNKTVQHTMPFEDGLMLLMFLAGLLVRHNCSSEGGAHRSTFYRCRVSIGTYLLGGGDDQSGSFPFQWRRQWMGVPNQSLTYPKLLFLVSSILFYYQSPKMYFIYIRLLCI